MSRSRGPRSRLPTAASDARDLVASLGLERAAELAREIAGQVSERTSRRTVSLRLPPAKLAAYRAAARAAGLTLTAWIEQAADAALEDRR